jgi:hypothetical protein
MSAPEQNGSSPAPRNTMTRTVLSSDNSPISRVTDFHMSKESAFRRSGRSRMR